MPNNAVRAAAEGMPNLNRRSLLLALAAASTAAATPVATAAAAHSENPELIRLGDMLPKIVGEYRDASATVRRIVAEWSPKWPRAPEAIFDGWGGRSIERDLTGNGFWHRNAWGSEDVRGIWTVEELSWRLESMDKSVARARTDRSRASRLERRKPYAELLPIAQRYEAACERIRRVSGYGAAYTREIAAEKALSATVKAIMEQPENSMAGVIIKAQALAAADALPNILWAIKEGSLMWGSALAASILRQGGGSDDSGRVPA